MADFLVVVDPDPLRRRTCLERGRARLASLPGTVVETAEIGPCAAVWSRFPAAPCSVSVRPNRFALLLGYALAETDVRLTADDIADRFTAPGRSETDGDALTFDGYHVALVWSPETGLTLGCDPLGLFPAYFTVYDGTIATASSPGLCAMHPACSGDPDPAGLAGVLLINGLIAGRSILRGVRRTAAGKLLTWTPHAGVRERETFALSPSDDLRRASPSETQDRVEVEMRRAVRRHRPAGEAAGLMLSGGLDSRLTAGILTSEGLLDRAITLGRDDDLDVRGAGRVAETLGLRFLRQEDEGSPADMVAAARRIAADECLSGGLANPLIGDDARLVGAMSPEFWSGYLLDDIVGGYAVRYGRTIETSAWSTNHFFNRSNRWGLDPDTAAGLFAPVGGRDLIAACIQDFERDYAAGPGDTYRQSFRMKFMSRARFHIGALLHRLSRCSWPLLPMTDRRVVRLAFDLAPEHLADRGVELRLLESRFPHLSNLPLDTNSFRFEPARRPDLPPQSLPQRAAATVRKWWRKLYWKGLRRDEPRRYHRLYDLNSPSWRLVREAAHAARDRLPDWLDRAALAAILPPPHVRIRVENPFPLGAKYRSLLGLCLYAEQASSRSAGRAAA